MKVAVIGCGTIANSAHIPAYLANEKAEIKYFCDIIPERAQAAVEKYGCGTAIADYKEVLAGNDVKMACGFPHQLTDAVEAGVLTKKDLELCARRVLDLILKLD